VKRYAFAAAAHLGAGPMLLHQGQSSPKTSAQNHTEPCIVVARDKLCL
jgi:hypothetical protein